jgi:hypothetical protein
VKSDSSEAECSRRGGDEVSGRRDGLEKPPGEHLDVAVPHGPEEVERQRVAEDQPGGAEPRRAGGRDGHRHEPADRHDLKRRREPSCIDRSRSSRDYKHYC